MTDIIAKKVRDCILYLESSEVVEFFKNLILSCPFGTNYGVM